MYTYKRVTLYRVNPIVRDIGPIQLNNLTATGIYSPINVIRRWISMVSEYNYTRLRRGRQRWRPTGLFTVLLYASADRNTENITFVNLDWSRRFCHCVQFIDVTSHSSTLALPLAYTSWVLLYCCIVYQVDINSVDRLVCRIVEMDRHLVLTPAHEQSFTTANAEIIAMWRGGCRRHPIWSDEKREKLSRRWYVAKRGSREEQLHFT